MKTRSERWNKSLAVRIPATCARDLGLCEGTEVDLGSGRQCSDTAPVTLAYTLEELVNRITPENVPGETDWGKSEGGEIW
jgi:antitoxin MazE